MSGLDALAEIHAAEQAAGIDPFAPLPVVQLAPTPPPPEQFVIEPFDSSSFVEPVREPDPPLVVEDTTTEPAKPRKGSRTPRLDATRAWRAEMMRGAS